MQLGTLTAPSPLLPWGVMRRHVSQSLQVRMEPWAVLQGPLSMMLAVGFGKDRGKHLLHSTQAKL